MLTVYVWKKREGSLGHASMGVDSPVGCSYISYWPKYAALSAPPIPFRAFSDDVSDEGQQPDATIRIEGLDETTIYSWWTQVTRDPTQQWNLITQNCSTTVANALNRGGAAELMGNLAFRAVWSPDQMLDFASALAAHSGGQGSPNIVDQGAGSQ
jgi:hypothetical protein